MTAAEITAASVEDAALVSALAIRTYTDTFGADFDPVELVHYLDETVSVGCWRQYMARDSVLVARSNGTAVGYVHFGPTPDGSMLEIHRLYVLRPFQRRGIGVALLQQALSAPSSAERPVRIDVWENNQDARRLYERFGFRDSGERKPFILKSGMIDGYDLVLLRRPQNDNRGSPRP